MPRLDIRSSVEREMRKHREAGIAQAFRDTQSSVMEKTVSLPFLPVSVTPAAGGVEMLPALQNTRYYVHSARITLRNTAAQTQTNAQILATFKGESQIIAKADIVPSVAGVTNFSCILDVLTDVNTAVTCQRSADSGNATCELMYAIIPEGEGVV